MTQTPPKPKPHPFTTIVGAVSALAGAGLARYTGINLLIPAVAGVIIGVIFGKTADSRKKPLALPIGIQGGHSAWLAVGAVVLLAMGGSILQVGLAVGIDLSILIGGLIWLALRPGIGPVILLSVYQGLLVVLNGFSISQADVGSTAHRALVVHIVLRALAIITMIACLRTMNRAAKPDAESAMAESTGP